MDIRIGWWNCSLSPPSTQAQKKEPCELFDAAIIHLLKDEALDIFCMCETDNKITEHIKLLLSASNLSNYSAACLYSKNGNSIEDFCIIYNHQKIRYHGLIASLNSRGPIVEEKLKVGLHIGLCFIDGYSFSLILCHWQSRNTYKDGSQQRNNLGAALRESIRAIKDKNNLKPIIICGDFNDEPFEKSIQHDLGASRDAGFVRRRSKALYNPFWSCLGMLPHETNAGTCTYKKDFEMTDSKTFDQIIFSSDFLSNEWKFSEAAILKSREHTAWEAISDHYPITCKLERVQE